QCSEYDEKGIISFVSIDNEKAAYQAVEHLILKGQEKIALVNSNEKFLYARERKQGYLKALYDYGLQVNDAWIYTSNDLEFNDRTTALNYFMDLHDTPPIIIYLSEISANVAVTDCRVATLDVPDDLTPRLIDGIEVAHTTR